MSIPEDVITLAEERAAARASREYQRADALRDRIREAGWDVVDRPDGYDLVERVAEEPSGRLAHEQLESVLHQPAARDVSVHWLIDGEWSGDVVRGITSFRASSPEVTQQHVVVDLVGAEASVLPGDVELIRLRKEDGWAAARNEGLHRSLGRVVVVVDGSVEAVGAVLAPIIAALEDPTTGITGPFGLVTDDLHEFRESPGPEVDAIEGYLMAFRRDLVRDGLAFDPKFRFYRMADVELSVRVKAMGLRAMVTDVPVRRHEHRMWATTPQTERDRLSKRNFYRFLDRWRGRTDLLVSPGS
jgi:Glycosyl transferase family 2